MPNSGGSGGTGSGTGEPKRRTKTGCLTCRKRRVRCDELHPTCSACIRLKLQCVYPTPQPQLPNNLGQRPQTSDRPRPGRPRLSAIPPGTQSVDRPRLGRPPRSATPSKEKRRQTVGGNTEADDTEMRDREESANSLFPGLVKGKATHFDESIASSSSAPSTPANDSPWYAMGNNGNGVTKSSSRASSKQAVAAVDASHATNPSRLADGAVAKLENTDTSFGLVKDRSNEPSEPMTELNGSSLVSNGFLSDKTKRTVAITVEDQEPFQHFMSTMVKFCPLRNAGEDNLYCNILSTLGLFHESLFNAMMAWSSLHLAHLRNKSSTVAEVRHDNACTLLQKDSVNGTHVDVILATMWFLIEYERLLARDVDKVRKILELASETIQKELGNRGGAASLSRIGPVGSIVLAWMAAIDCQAVHFGGAGRIISDLQTHPHMVQFIEKSAVTEETPMSSEWGAVSNHTDETKQLQTCMNLSLHTMMLTGQIVLLGRWQRVKLDSPSWQVVNGGLEGLEREVEKDISPAATAAMTVAEGGHYLTPPTLTALGYNRLLLLASYYAAIIVYQQYGPSSIVAEPRDSSVAGVTENCAQRIIRIAQRICHDRPNTPQTVLPALFIAAMVVKDQVYQSWTISVFEKAERWGANMVKARKLLQGIIERQNGTGIRLDFVNAMEEMTGYFIV